MGKYGRKRRFRSSKPILASVESRLIYSSLEDADGIEEQYVQR